MIQWINQKQVATKWWSKSDIQQINQEVSSNKPNDQKLIFNELMKKSMNNCK